MTKPKHKPWCKINMDCLVVHENGVCPGPYGTCTCSDTPPPISSSEKEERLNCPYCNPNTPYGASPQFFDQWKIKHEYHANKSSSAEKPSGEPPEEKGWENSFEKFWATKDAKPWKEAVKNFIRQKIAEAREEGIKIGSEKYDEMIEYHKDLREKKVAEARAEERARLKKICEGKKANLRMMSKKDEKAIQQTFGYAQACADIISSLDKND